MIVSHRIATCGLVCALFTATIAQAEEVMASEAPKKAMKMMKSQGLKGQLGLSAEQKQKFKQLMQSSRVKRKMLRKELQNGRMQLRNLSTSNDYSAEKADMLAENQAKSYKAMLLLESSTRNQFYQMLTPSQQTLYIKRMAQQDMMRKQHREKWMKKKKQMRQQMKQMKQMKQQDQQTQ